MRFLGLMVLVFSCALGTDAVATASKSVEGGCRDLTVAQAKRILGPGVTLSQNSDFIYGTGRRTICAVSFDELGTAPASISIVSESAKSFAGQIDYYRRGTETGRVRRLVSVRLGDGGYSLDKYFSAGTIGKKFESHMLVFRVGGRMFQLEDFGTRRSVTTAKRLALAKAIVTTARSRS
jgi:hypothetical protein